MRVLTWIGVIVLGFVLLEVFRAALALLNQPSDPLFYGGVVLVCAVLAIVAWLARLGLKAAARRLAIVIAVLLLAATGCTRVGPGYVGIKVSMAGDDRGVDSAPRVTGWVFYNPVLSSVLEYPTFVQTAVWTLNKAEGNPANEEITFTNADQMKISVDVNLSYHLDPPKVPAFYVKFRSDDLTAFTHGFLHNKARDVFNEHAGKYKIEEIMGNNSAFLKDVRDGLQGEVSDIGVRIDQFGIIGAPRPPDAVTEAINAKVHATQLAQQKQNELIQVQADMAKEQAKTDTYARNLLKMADAQAQSNLLVAKSLTPELVEVKRLEKWNGVLPQVTSGASPFITLK